MRWLLLTLLLSSLSAAQTQGGLPTLVEGLSGNNNTPAFTCGANCIQFQENVTAGDLVFVEATQQRIASGCTSNPAITDPPWTPTDNQMNIYTVLTPVHANITGGYNWLQGAYTFAASTGTLQITVLGLGSDCTGLFEMGHFACPSCVADGSVQSDSPATGTGIITSTTSPSTNFNGDLIISWAADQVGSGGGAHINPQINVQSAVQDGVNNNGGNTMFGFMNAGVAGSYSITYGETGGGGGSRLMSQSLPFKVASMSIVTTKLFDCVVGTACSQQLMAIGGTGAYTWSTTAGTCSGFSMTDTVNGIYSAASPGAVGTCTITFHVTDGTLSANKTLSFSVASAFIGAPFLRNSFAWNGNSGGTHTISVTGATCGDIIAIMPQGNNTHGGEGWAQQWAGTNNKVTDTFGSPVYRGTISGNRAAPFPVVFIGPLASSGTDLVSVTINLAASSALPPSELMDIANVQGVFNPSTYGGNITNTVPATVSRNFTTLVANEFVLYGTDIPGADSLSIGAPFTLINAGTDGALNTSLYAYDVVSSPSTITAATSNSVLGVAFWGTNIVSLRPRLPISACGEVSTAVRHKAEVI